MWLRQQPRQKVLGHTNPEPGTQALSSAHKQHLQAALPQRGACLAPGPAPAGNTGFLPSLPKGVRILSSAAGMVPGTLPGCSRGLGACQAHRTQPSPCPARCRAPRGLRWCFRCHYRAQPTRAGPRGERCFSARLRGSKAGDRGGGATGAFPSPVPREKPPGPLPAPSRSSDRRPAPPRCPFLCCLPAAPPGRLRSTDGIAGRFVLKGS